MRSTCRACGRTLSVIEAVRGRCSEWSECYARQIQPGEPPVVTWHPDSLPPEDIDVCSECKGSGKVHTSQYPDWMSGARPVKDCPRCQTTGKEPVS